ncbi:peptidoglycan bridge formation glycyltransferase FemA/FemB family protein [Desulfobulbus sp.]|uniref:lipid II:glycine glycyltransferase FemX n=1 Tax=Desulfobulbus sp. TaxID=895 RepID=UPI00286EEF53|nr:peptidoglycan bridge formation glycyltransferase FemA/FemB family protein [Desulfobulbus sp.]
MNVTIVPKRPGKLYPTDILFQSRYWSDVKARLGWKAYAFDIESTGIDKDMLVIVKPFGPRAVAAYVPQGPEFAPDQEDYGTYLEALSESIVEQIDADISFIRYDLPWESPYAAEMRQQNWHDFPESRVREMRMNFGTKHWNLKKAPVDVTVANSCVVDLDGDDRHLLARMKPKTRYNIGLAERKGVRVHIASAEQLPIFYRLYCQTSRRHGFHTNDYQYFSALFSASKRHYDSSEVLLLLACRGQEALAGAIVVLSGKGALFLHGASADHQREYMASYLMHWKAIQYARARQCRTYDMGAVSPSDDPGHSFHGLYRFKTGFGGRIVHNSGSWDYPVKKEVYRDFRNWEMVLSQHEGGHAIGE